MKAKEAQITHTDRLALMGQMAAGVAHDLSNLISPILGYAQIILRNRDAIDPTLADITERILGTTRRAHVLLRQMVNLSGVHSDDHEEVDLNDLAREMLLLLETKISHAEVILEEDYAHDLLFTFGNPVQISQVILNILVNALDAMPSGGKLTVRTTAASMDGKAMVKLQIADTGEGIAPENLANIFNTFFTTKHKKAGTGLGLSICRDIVENHNGTITVDSTFGEGSQFTILLPQLNEDSQ
jgi:signal transduction histidine kinase